MDKPDYMHYAEMRRIPFGVRAFAFNLVTVKIRVKTDLAKYIQKYMSELDPQSRLLYVPSARKEGIYSVIGLLHYRDAEKFGVLLRKGKIARLLTEYEKQTNQINEYCKELSITI